MDDYETFTEVNLIWDPVSLKWARPKQNDSLSLVPGHSNYQHLQDVDNDLINTLQAAGVDLSQLNLGRDIYGGTNDYAQHGMDLDHDRNVIDDYAYTAAKESCENLRYANGYYRNQLGNGSHSLGTHIQPTFQYKVPGKRKARRYLDTVCMIYFVTLIVTVLVVGQFLLLPLIYEDSPVTLRYRTWFCWFVFYHILINYVLTYIYSGPYEQSSRNFADPGLPQSGWNRCEDCEQLKPPRTHHCPFCDKCVLKRDHHCFFAGACIGFHNQRHFIVMCFYSSMGAMYAFYLLWQYFCMEYYFPISSDFWHFILPATIVEWMVGRSSVLFMFLVLLLYLVATSGAGASVMFFWQMYLVFSGVTTHEFAKGIKTYKGAPLREKIQSVFGPWFLIQFIFPMPLIDIHGDGMHWTHVMKRI